MRTKMVSVGSADPARAVADRAVDVGAAAELDREQHVDRVVDRIGEVDDGRCRTPRAAC